jgi:DNA gyrase/topoisomerase IV subunit A
MGMFGATRIEDAIDILTEADLIPDEEVVVTLTLKGYVKRVPLVLYDVQHRGGKGKMGMAALEDDVIQDIFVAKNHDTYSFSPHLVVYTVCKLLKFLRHLAWQKGVQLLTCCHYNRMRRL